ncbi:hypothetical protein B0T21DRAFT_408626 [Apiosordaria backusii]|uniref:Uncharacterized protein n=1 Tax=Apiosordaria backusii TaxID=314023 RepID=A0AA40K0S9_9PEZI|nr:hypothetical protein B0T21DRAFT_408626 [Apiosordaria backusii]
MENGGAYAAQKAANDQIMKTLQRENGMIATAWYDLSSRLQSNHVVLARRQDAPKSWINKQRQMVNGEFWGVLYANPTPASGGLGGFVLVLVLLDIPPVPAATLARPEFAIFPPPTGTIRGTPLAIGFVFAVRPGRGRAGSSLVPSSHQKGGGGGGGGGKTGKYGGEREGEDRRVSTGWGIECE